MPSSWGARRIIPILLLDGPRLVKTVRFGEPAYVGDPSNVLSIFNDLEVDEIMLLDIRAARTRESIALEDLAQYASECFVPMSFGGAITDTRTALGVVSTGVEKVVVNSALVEQPSEVAKVVETLGAQAVIGAVDLRERDGAFEVRTRGDSASPGLFLDDWIDLAKEVGVGEILVTSIDREGTRQGIDLQLIDHVTSRVDVPVIAHGGVGSRGDLLAPLDRAGASAVAAGTHFVFQSDKSSVLVNYPSGPELAVLRAADTPSPKTPSTRPLAPSAMLPPNGPRMCRNCIITDEVPGASLDDDGICYYCHLHRQLDRQYPIGESGRRELERLMDSLRLAGRGRDFDCIVGVSGGCDSSYLVHLLAEHQVRPLAVHFDNTWNSPVATSNIYAVLNKLGIPLETYVVDNREFDDLCLAFLKAGVRDVEAPTDIGFMGVLYRYARKHRIRHIVEGASFRTEGVSPLGWLYMDGRYIESVHERYGTRPLRTFPNMSFREFLNWTVFSGIQRHRPLYHVDYQKEDVKRFLTATYEWQWYGGHHLENRFTAFYHTYLLPTRFGIDFRQIEYSALVRSGQLDRDEAVSLWRAPRHVDTDLLELIKKRLNLTDDDFSRLMEAPHRSYRDFDTYKSQFQRFRPLFWALYRSGRIPKSFYVKFCL